MKDRSLNPFFPRRPLGFTTNLPQLSQIYTLQKLWEETASLRPKESSAVPIPNTLTWLIFVKSCSSKRDLTSLIPEIKVTDNL